MFGLWASKGGRTLPTQTNPTQVKSWRSRFLLYGGEEGGSQSLGSWPSSAQECLSGDQRGGPRQKELAGSAAGRVRVRNQEELPGSKRSKSLFWGGCGISFRGVLSAKERSFW